VQDANEEEAERASQEQEAQERARLRAKAKKAKQKIQRWVKRPVFILGVFLSFSAWTLQVDLEASATQFNTSLVAFLLLLALYFKMLTDSLNWVHDQLQEDNVKSTYKPTKFNNIVIYGVAALFPTLVFAGLYLLVFHVLLERLV